METRSQHIFLKFLIYFYCSQKATVIVNFFLKTHRNPSSISLKLQHILFIKICLDETPLLHYDIAFATHLYTNHTTLLMPL